MNPGSRGNSARRGQCKNSFAMQVCFYHADIPIEQRYPIIEGDHLKILISMRRNPRNSYQVIISELREKEPPSTILMDSVEQANRFSDIVSELTVGTVHEIGEEVVASLSLIVKRLSP